jgi:MFS family permease
MLGAAFGVGFVIGPAIGGLAHFNARLPFVIAGVIALVNAAVALVRLPETPGPKANRTVAAEDLRADFAVPDDVGAARRRRRDLLLLAAAGFLATAAFAGFESTFSLFGARRFHLTLGSAAVVFVGIGIALVIVQGALVGKVTARLGARRAYVGGIAVCGLGLAVLAGATVWVVLVVALGLLVLGQGIATPTLTSLVVDRARADRRGEALGFQQSAGSLARIAGPAAAGLLFDRAGVAWPYVVGAVLMAVVVGLVVSERT